MKNMEKIGNDPENIKLFLIAISENEPYQSKKIIEAIRNRDSRVISFFGNDYNIEEIENAIKEYEAQRIEALKSQIVGKSLSGRAGRKGIADLYKSLETLKSGKGDTEASIDDWMDELMKRESQEVYTNIFAGMNKEMDSQGASEEEKANVFMEYYLENPELYTNVMRNLEQKFLNRENVSENDKIYSLMEKSKKIADKKLKSPEVTKAVIKDVNDQIAQDPSNPNVAKRGLTQLAALSVRSIKGIYSVPIDVTNAIGGVLTRMGENINDYLDGLGNLKMPAFQRVAEELPESQGGKVNVINQFRMKIKERFFARSKVDHDSQIEEANDIKKLKLETIEVDKSPKKIKETPEDDGR